MSLKMILILFLVQLTVSKLFTGRAGACFERLMECVLAGLNWQICLLYLDIIIFSESFEQHIERLELVISKIEKAGLKISPKKFSLFQEKVIFLGHVVSKDGISTDPEKISAVKDWSVPLSLHDVRSFLGTCSYYRRFIQNFSDIPRPLHKLTEKAREFKWSEECQNSFDPLKQF